MAGLNKVMLIGNLGADPEARTMQSGDKVVSFTLATGDSWKDKVTGERKEATEWHKIVIFHQALGDVAERYLKKGSQVYLEGEIKTRNYVDKDGVTRYISEVVLGRVNARLTLLGSAPDRDGDRGSDRGAGRAEPARTNPRAAARQTSDAWNTPRGGGDLDDDIPFAPSWQ